MSTPDLTIIIVNWNSKDFLRKCLRSVRETTGQACYQIIVVDNATFDGCAEMLQSEFPEVVFIQSPTNLGFGKANNLAAARSTGRHLLFLNPDTEVIGSALATMVSFADQRPDVGIVGPKLLNTDLTLQMESVRAFPSLLNQILDSYYLKSRFPRLPIWGMQPLFNTSASPAAVDVVSGACLMIRREVFERVGGFSRQYFMYSEDVDLCHKAKVAGWATYYVGGAEVIHHGGKSSTLSPVSQFSAVLTRESRFQFLCTARGSTYALMFRLFTAGNAVLRLALLILSFPLLGIRRSAAVLATMHKWLSILRWSVGLERWVKTLV
jgi:GT2 family glycosyltransferase